MSAETTARADQALRRVVAIDGPGGSGKSTVAKMVADATGLDYLDTGAMYRSIAFGVLQREIDPTDWPAVAAVVGNIQLTVGRDHVTVDGTDATAAIRGPEVTRNVSAVAANPAVRAAMVRLQREWLVQRNGGVLEGRDIGTVVAPDSPVKVYLTASVAERARRRALETGEDVAEVEADLLRRDTADSQRSDSPLKPASDSVNVDTTGQTVLEVVATIVELVEERIGT